MGRLPRRSADRTPGLRERPVLDATPGARRGHAHAHARRPVAGDHAAHRRAMDGGARRRAGLDGSAAAARHSGAIRSLCLSGNLGGVGRGADPEQRPSRPPDALRLSLRRAPARGRRGRMAGAPHRVLYRKRGRFIEAIQSSGDRRGPAAAHPAAPVSGRARGSSALLHGRRREATPARQCGLGAPICPAGEQFGHVLASRRRYAFPHAGGVCAAPRPLLQQPADPDQQPDENDRAGRGASHPQRRPPGPSPPRPWRLES